MSKIWMGGSLYFSMTGLASKCYSKSLHLRDCHLMPPTVGFRHHGQEDDALPLASLSRFLHLGFEGVIEGVPSSCGCSNHCVPLAGVDDSDVQSDVFPSLPVWTNASTGIWRGQMPGRTNNSKDKCLDLWVQAFVLLALVRTKCGFRA